MASAAEVTDNSADIKRHAAVSDNQLVARVFKEKPGGGTTGAGHPCAAGIEGTDTPGDSIGSDMSMAAYYYICAATSEQLLQFLVSDARFDARTVIGSG